MVWIVLLTAACILAGTGNVTEPTLAPQKILLLTFAAPAEANQNDQTRQQGAALVAEVNTIGSLQIVSRHSNVPLERIPAAKAAASPEGYDQVWILISPQLTAGLDEAKTRERMAIIAGPRATTAPPEALKAYAALELAPADCRTAILTNDKASISDAPEEDKTPLGRRATPVTRGPTPVPQLTVTAAYIECAVRPSAQALLRPIRTTADELPTETDLPAEWARRGFERLPGNFPEAVTTDAIVNKLGTAAGTVELSIAVRPQNSDRIRTYSVLLTMPVPPEPTRVHPSPKPGPN
ncbi:MAG: hypothetical protein JNK25_01520 [Phycisphaerae bacterium]|nr:hypothetical protein [Phycisphaerae bacterium]